MGEDDRRMHEGDRPGLVPGRSHERHETPEQLNHAEPGEGDSVDAAGNGSGGSSDVTDGDQDSALGGRVATRSAAPNDAKNRSVGNG